MQPTPLAIALGGAVLIVVLLFQVATGKRWLRFGKRQVRIHSWGALVVLSLTALHALGGLVYLGYIPSP